MIDNVCCCLFGSTNYLSCVTAGYLVPRKCCLGIRMYSVGDGDVRCAQCHCHQCLTASFECSTTSVTWRTATRVKPHMSVLMHNIVLASVLQPQALSPNSIAFLLELLHPHIFLIIPIFCYLCPVGHHNWHAICARRTHPLIARVGTRLITHNLAGHV